jgi:formiminoglutamase
MITIPKEQMPCLLQNSEAKYVIIGIPEDIGIRANFTRKQLQHGKLQLNIANIQHNRFVKGAKLLF